MRILYITDTHLTAKNPASRLDVYYLSTIKKFYEVGQIVKRENIDIVLHGGDLFHTPRVSLKYAGEIANIIKSWGVPVYVVPGNHDIYGYNIDTIDQTMLGMFAKTKVVNLLTRSNPVYLEETFNGKSFEIALEGQEYYADIDQGNKGDYMSIATSDFTILAAHGMLLPKPFMPDVPCTLIQDTINTPNVVLVGHYHPGWDMEVFNGTTFFNPGSSLRVEASTHNKNNIPKCLLLDVKPNASGSQLEFDWKYIEYQTAMPGTQIFDYNAKQAVKQSAALLNQFKQTIQNTTALQNVTTIPDMIKAIAQLSNVDASVVNQALNYIAAAQATAEDTLPEVKGFIEKAGSIWITKAEIKNFQSHKNSVIDFEKGLNVIAGETNKGKTAVIRAILWCLYNDPKGSDFITTGETECSVKLYFSDGSALERKRTNKDAGSYIVTTVNGDMKEYSGFNNDIPVEVMNEHQMPEIYLAKDFKVRLNVASQLDKSFLIAESPAVKAAAVGRLIGVQVVDDAIKSVAKDNLNYNKKVKDLDKQIESNNNDLKKFDVLDDMKLYIDAFEYLIALHETTEKELNELGEMLSLYDGCQIEINTVKSTLANIKDLEPYRADIEQGLKLEAELELLCSLQNQLEDVRNDIAYTEDLLSKIPPAGVYDPLLDEMNSLIKEIEQVYELRQERAAVYTQIKSLENIIQGQDTSVIESCINDSISEVEALLKVVGLYRELDKVKGEIGDVQEDLDSLNDIYKKNLSDIKKTEEAIEKCIEASGGACPFCGGKVGKEHMEHILAS